MLSFASETHPSSLARARELRGAWAWAFGISAATYLYLMMQFPIGNHDWLRLGGVPFVSYQVKLGRWFDPIVFSLTSFRQLPMLNATLALGAYVTAGFLTARLIEICLRARLTPMAYSAAGLLAALIPHSNWTFFFSWQAAVGPTAQLLCVLGILLLVEKTTWRRALACSVLFCLSMATYQATLDTAAVLFFFVVICIASSTTEPLKESGRRLGVLGGAIGVGAILYKLSLKLLGALGVLANTYHFRFLSFSEIPARAVELVKISFGHFVVPHPFFPLALKLMLLVAALVGVWVLIERALLARDHYPPSWLRVVIVVSGFALMVYATKIQFLVSQQDEFFRNRFAAFGNNFVYVPLITVGTLVTVRWKAWLQRGVLALGIWTCINQDLEWQDAHVKQHDYDKRVLTRVIARIESLPGFSYEKSYALVQVGGLENIRENYFPYDGPASPYHRYTAIPGWAPEDPYVGLEPRLRLKKSSSMLTKLMPHGGERVQQLVEYTKQARPWPDESSVQLIGKDIIVILGKTKFDEELRKGKKRKL